MTVRLIIATGKSNKGREPSSLTCAELHNDNGRNSFTDISLKKHAIDFFLQVHVLCRYFGRFHTNTSIYQKYLHDCIILR